MSDKYDNTNRGSLFRNQKKEKETHSDYNGSINIEGKEYWLNAWVKEIKNGEKAGQKFFSLSVQPKQPKPESSRGSYGDETTTNGNPSLHDESDVPF